jgi:hypothetical protein
MLLVESIRQAGIAIAHEYYGVAEDDRILWHDLSFTLDADQLLLDERPADVVFGIVAHQVRRRGKTLAGMHMTCDCTRAGRRLGVCELSWSTLSPRAYARVRGARLDVRPDPRPLAAPVAPWLVGRDSPADVVLSESPAGEPWPLRVNTRHPVMFDHPVDHVPGMVAIEATRQAALLATGSPHGLPIHGTFAFTHYIEHDTPCTVRAALHPPTATSTITVSLNQSGTTAVQATLALSVPQLEDR